MVQFLKNYVNPQGVETPIVIRLRIARTWLRKLGYVYKDVHKDVFVDGHEQSDVGKDCANFLKQMKELKPLLSFDADVNEKSSSRWWASSLHLVQLLSSVRCRLLLAKRAHPDPRYENQIAQLIE